MSTGFIPGINNRKIIYMNKYSELQKFLSVLITFIQLIYLTGCYSLRTVSNLRLVEQDAFFTIHGKYGNIQAQSLGISNGVLLCRFDSNKENSSIADKTHIYLSSDSDMKIGDGRISVPINNISKIQEKNYSPSKTTIASAIGIAGAALVTIIIVIAIFGGNMRIIDM